MRSEQGTVNREQITDNKKQKTGNGEPAKVHGSRFTDHALVTWGPVAAVIVTVGVYFISQVTAGLLLIGYTSLRGWDNSQINHWLLTSVTAQFGFVLLIEAITFWLIWLFLNKRKTTLRAIGIVKAKWTDLLYALAGFGAYFVLAGVVLNFVSQLFPQIDAGQKQQIGFDTANSPLELLLVFLSLAILPPIVEEIVTRGFLYTGLKKHFRIFRAGLITSILFALAHLQFGSGEPLLWIAGIDTFILSWILISVKELSGGSLWPAIFLHVLKNGLAFLTLFILRL